MAARIEEQCVCLMILTFLYGVIAMRLIQGFCIVPMSEPVHQKKTRRGIPSLLALAGALSFAHVSAEEPAVKGSRISAKGPVIQPQATAEATAVPECLEKLKLSTKQEDQIKGIIHEYDGSLSTVWKQFGERYLQTITLEASLLAAIEDNLTEPQRQHVRDLRRKTAQHEKSVASTVEKPNQAKTKPADAVQDELAGVGVTLSAEQESMAEKVEEKYRSQLRSLNRDIQGLHTRLLSLEADKLVAIEKVLTKDQLTQLRQNRQNAPDAPKVVLSKVDTKKSE